MKYITSFVLSIFLISISHSQVITDNVRDVSEREVPRAVKENQKSFFPLKFNTNWQAISISEVIDPKSLRYVAKFEDGDRSGFTASYLPSGLLIFNSEFMPAKIIPLDIRLDIAKEFEKFSIESAVFITFYKPNRKIYMVKLLRDTGFFYVYYNADGIKLPETTISPELVVLKK
ncbi:hypothetical protein [Aequorivita capsosiphonis]|uniref:hypothetical protein n=1 Tax=Aequorivita capsosiphonis TaxID=487317 RepID=UPI000409E345|nr:hypothetical protein [Aequorivita capsosiphonis]